MDDITVEVVRITPDESGNGIFWVFGAVDGEDEWLLGSIDQRPWRGVFYRSPLYQVLSFEGFTWLDPNIY